MNIFFATIWSIGPLEISLLDTILSVVLIFFIFAFAITTFHNVQKSKAVIRDSLDISIIRVKVPREMMNEEEKRLDLKTMLGGVEPFFANVWSMYKKHNFFERFMGKSVPVLSMEIVSQNEQIFFYFTISRKFKNFLERQIHSVWSDASIEEVLEDHKIFDSEGFVECAELMTEKNSLLPIKTYKNLDYDPLNSITTAISKMKGTEAGVIQILIQPVSSDEWRDSAKSKIKAIQKGEDKKESFGAKAGKVIGKGLSEILSSFGESVSPEQAQKNEQKKLQKEQEEKQEKRELTPMDQERIKAIAEKTTKLGFDTVIRIAIINDNKEVAKQRLENVLGIFTQFEHPEFNKFKKRRSSSPKLITDFVLRTFPILSKDLETRSILNTEELATIFHLPNKYCTVPDIRWLPSKKAQAPPNLPTEGTLMGVTNYRGMQKEVRIKPEDRFRHMYIIGQTGVGKTYFQKQMIISDILQGNGVCFLDPHGEDAEDILNYIPKERAEDVIYFDPGDFSRPMGLNIMEPHDDDEKDMLTQEFINILFQLFDAETMGPIFEHSVRNCMLALMDDETCTRTLVEMPRMQADEKFAESIGKKAKNFLVRDYFLIEMKNSSANSKGERLSYIISKFGRFITAPQMRNIIGQSKSSFDFMDIMQNGKILICNLSKGKIGVFNASLLGQIIVSKLKAAAFQRAKMGQEARTPMFLYADEFQNFANDSFAEILSEARKYRLSLTMGHQYVKQLPEKVKDAVIGNVGTVCVFRTGIEDSEALEKLFPKVFDKNDISQLPNRNAFVRLMIDGQNGEPFSMETVPIRAPRNEKLGKLIKELSKLKFGRPRELVEMEIEERMRFEQ
ncbi:MAG: hypothetical protein Fur0024_0570 [Patescibacteria group bacterium]